MRFLPAFLTLGLSFAAIGCGTVDNIGDCSAICDRYKSCYDSSYDVSACYDRCRSNSKSDSDFQHKVDQCHACIDGRDCAAAAFGCAAECNGIVP